MAQGLDELIEWLVREVAFYGDGKSTLNRRIDSPVAKKKKKKKNHGPVLVIL